ncbi:MAG: GntR family transcriptional regulator [Anaerolineales bacterium]|jgi:GntR family transcriptional regulator
MTNMQLKHRTLSQRLHDDLAAMIGMAKPGEQLPTEPDLAKQLGVSRATLREAMRTFETQGLLLRRQGVGTFVVRPTQVLESGLEVLESIDTLAQHKGLQVSQQQLKLERRPATRVECDALSLALDCQVLSISRVIMSEERPVAYLVDILPEEVIAAAEIDEDFNGSVLDLLLTRGYPKLANSHCEIAAVAADSTISRALHIQRGDAILKLNSRLFALDGRVIDYSYSYFLPGYFRFHVVRELNHN